MQEISVAKRPVVICLFHSDELGSLGKLGCGDALTGRLTTSAQNHPPVEPSDRAGSAWKTVLLPFSLQGPGRSSA